MKMLWISSKSCILFMVLMVHVKKTNELIIPAIPTFNLAVSQKDNIEAQPGGGGRWTFPEDCISNCRYVEWTPSASMIQFRIRGNFTGYVAMAISSNTNMTGIDNAYICSRTAPSSDSIQLRSAVLVGEVKPVQYTQISNFTSIISEGFLTCTFQRPLSITQTVSGNSVTWDLSTTEFNMLYAEGHVHANGDLIVHTYRAHTNKAFNYLSNTGYRQQGPPPPISSLGPFTSPPVTKVSPKDNIVAMSGGGGKWTFPENCKSNCRYIEWDHELPNIRFTIRGNFTGYVALAISLNTDMFGNDEAYICSRTKPDSPTIQLRSAVLVGEKPPVSYSQQTNFTTKKSDGYLTCTFWRPLSVTKKVSGTLVNWNLLTTDFNMLYAEGAVDSSGNILQHTYRTHTHGAFSYVNNEGYQSPGDGSSASRHIMHSCLSVVLLILTVVLAL